MAESIQTRASHRRFIPLWHFFVLPVLTANFIIAALHFYRVPTFDSGWNTVVAIALLTGIFLSRTMPLRAQDRVIRLEERLRFEKILPADLRGRVGDLTPEQLIGLRFAPDDEVPELTRRALKGELRTRADIKREIRNWRPDHFRV